MSPVSQSKRFVGQETRDDFRSAMAELNRRVSASGGRLAVSIVEPPGMPHCSGSLMQERCEWLKADMVTMSRLLDEAGVTHQMVQGIWGWGMEFIVPPRARDGSARHARDAPKCTAGHAKLAEEIWPFLASSM